LSEVVKGQSTETWSRRLPVALLLLFTLLNSFLWSRTLPFEQSPDEGAHFEVVEFIVEHGRTAVVGIDLPPASVHYDVHGHPYAYYTYHVQPPLPYLLDSLFARFGRTVEQRKMLARIPGVVLAPLMTLFVVMVTRWITRSSSTAFLAGVLSATWPQLVFIFSYVNNDALTVFLSSAVIVAWYAAARSGWTPRLALLTGAIVGALVLTKPTAVVVSLVVFLVVMIASPSATRWKNIALLIGGALTVSGWWFVQAMQRYGLDIFAERLSREYAHSLGAQWRPGKMFGFGYLGLLFHRTPLVSDSWIVATLKSAYGLFGSMTVPLPDGIYLLVLLLAVVAVAGAIWKFRPETSRPMLYAHLASLFLSLLLIASSLYRSYEYDYQPQGRYLLPAILPWLALFAAGFTAYATNVRQRKLIVFGTTLFFLALNGLTLFVTIAGHYYETSAAWLTAVGTVSVGTWSLATAALLLIAARMKIEEHA
jgi:4-amino-4-deoxy-L-arabinose transferase-like glycosyltransferase